MNKKYTFSGAAYAFNRLVDNNWNATTYAVSSSKAMANLKYQFRKKIGVVQSTPIRLDGKLMEVGTYAG